MGMQRRARRRKDYILGVLCMLVAFSALTLFLNAGGTTFTRGIDRNLRDLVDLSYSQSVDKHAMLNLTTRVHNTLISLDKVIETSMDSFTVPTFIASSKYPCGNHTDILVYFNSKWGNYVKRRRLRSTWASRKIFSKRNVHFVFILGQPETTDDLVRLKNEQALHGDLIIGDFVDSYHNLTLKSIVAINFIQTHCKSVKYILKADDDIFVNLFKVMAELLPVMHSDQNEIACHVIESGKSPILRDKASRWYIPPHIFPNQTYLPQFCSGYMVIITSRLLSNLQTKIQVTPLIHVDDVYMFGRLLQDISPVKFIDIKQNLTLWQDKGVEHYKKGQQDYFAVNVRDLEAMEELWSLVLMKST